MPRAAPAFLMTVATALAAGGGMCAARVGGTADSPPAAAAAAAEQGWFGRARELWQQGGAEGGGADGFLARLAALEREVELAARDRGRAEARRWAAGGCRTAWRHDLSGVSAAWPPVISGELVLWNTGVAVHAVRLEDGMPPWPAGGAGRDTRLFPRGSATAPNGGLAATATPGALCAAGSRAYAVLARPASEEIVCLDLSPAAEGRLVWLVDVAHVATAGLGRVAGPLQCDGPPAVDHELCCIVLRTAGGRGELILAAFAAADGRLEWTQRCGTALAADGVDHARGRRRPVFVEDRIVLATHAGTIIAFDRDGRRAWRSELPAAAPRPRADDALAPRFPAVPDTLASRGLAVVAPRDAGGVVAIEARGGAVAWRWAADDAVVGLLGPVEEGVVAVTRTAGDAAGLVRLDRASGREAGQPGTVSGPTSGPVTLVDHTLFHPRSPKAGVGGIVLDVVDPVSLAARRPLSVDVAPSATAADQGSPVCFVAGGGGRLAVAVPGAIVCVEAAAVAADE